ncbi:hypothetical protein RclHR1_06000003 [Rhizophagus clarus]|uniref:Uracil-DNA glycosylase-like protein n=1 Tax=Rhizophagus clarus TaxID=94130 RepID=A0A2Z6SHM0_9GLOM|nr:hypothetical protein RclHR1_06000003 [Rhizophagus clarus]GES86303.1 uracil-DNA glycosylase-like protein [Rhizophagus clarus]
MLKRKTTSVSNDNKKQKVATLTQSSLSSWAKSQPQEQTLNFTNSEIFNKVNENKELLSLENKTMNSEWLKVLSDEMQKLYFIEVD